MTNDKRGNWKVIISVENKGNFVNYIYNVTYGEACASAQRQIENNNEVLGFLVTEA